MKSKERVIVTLIALLLFASMTVGYAVYGVQTRIEGQSTFHKNGTITISSATLTDFKNLINQENPLVDGTSIHFDCNFNVPRTEEALQDDYYAEYTITISNNTFYDYIFETTDFNPTLATINNENIEVSYSLDGIELGDSIPTLSDVTFTLRIIMVPNNVGDFNVSGDTEFELEQDTETGRLLGSMPKNITGDLKNQNDRILINVSVMNTYEANKTFHFSVSNSNFYLVDANNNNLGDFTISGNTTDTYPIYLKVQPSARFATEHQSMNIYFEPNDYPRSSMGVVVANVNQDPTLVDVEPPTISNVEGVFQATRGSIKVTYNGNDNVGIDHYKIETYRVENNNATLVSTNETVSDEEEYTVTGLAEGSYYFKVTAYDTSGQSATAQSGTQEYIWTMTVQITITQGGPNGNYTVDYGQTYTTTITANNNRNLPASLNITMGGQPLTNGYTYNQNNGRLNIPNVTGNLVIRGETTAANNVCLVEGTKVLLGDNTTKNIEDIQYDDLLMVWSYDTGTPTKEYPIWIEKEKQSSEYTKITFSDHSEIKIVGGHAFFSLDQKKFVKANNREDFHVGTKVLKVEKNHLKTVQVTNIETISEEVTYYFVASTRYYNIISNDFITTDAYTDITNLYPFDENMKWQEKPEEVLDYEVLKDVLPYYMFKGFRAGELSILLKSGQADLEEFKKYISFWITSDFMLKNPIMKDGSRYWTVSFSNSSEKQYIKEGEEITLPEGDWYSTSEHKIYHSNENVTVWTGMHFEKQ